MAPIQKHRLRERPGPPWRVGGVPRFGGSVRLIACALVGSQFVFCIPQLVSSTPQYAVPLVINPDQTITYQPTPAGDRISDFSTVGFNYGNTPLPNEPGGYQVPVIVTLQPQPGDQTDRLQAAIDFISTRPLVNGFRGALLLKAGQWDIYSANKISVRASGVVIRGEGDHPLTGTRIYARATTNENNTGNTLNSRLITFSGNSNTVNTSAKTLVDAVYIPSGTNVIPITGHAFAVNQRIQVRWPGTVAWQQASLYKWDATADVDPAVTFNRVITAVTANSITLDAPITTPLDPAYARGYVVPVTAFNNITNVGISHCYFESSYASDTDENHLWNATYFTNVEDGFMHHCTARYFAYSIAYVNTSTRKITINRSQCHDGISVLEGGRRYSFVLTGEMALVSNAIGRYGRHTFVINWPNAPGPNVFVDGVATGSYNESGSHARTWNNGGLWDNITDGLLQVKLERPAANCVAWNCTLNSITFENMPLSPNWSFGSEKTNGDPVGWVNSSSTGSFAYAAPHLGKGEQWSNGTRMPVRSLYEKQLETRLKAAKNPHRYQADPPTRISYLPVIRTPAQLVALSGSAWSYQLPVSNLVPATRTPNYTVTGLPAGVTVNATTGLISGILPTVSIETDYNLTLSARNIDGTTTKPMTLTVRPTGSPKIPLGMGVEVDLQRTTPLALIAGQSAVPVPMVPASRLLAPMMVRKSYTSDMNGTVYTAADIPVPVRGVLSLEGLTSPVTVTYNGSTTLPTAPGYYAVVATLDDPIYQATAAGQLLITTAAAVTVTLNNTTSPTAASPVTATSTQSSITPVITYDGSGTFPSTPGYYTAKAIVANADYFGSRLALISVQRPSATLTWGNLSLHYTGMVQSPAVTTNPPGLPTQVSILGQGIFPGTYLVTASITDPIYSHTPIAGTMTITGLVISTPGNLNVTGSASGALVNFEVSAGDGFTATTPALANPPSGSLFPVGTTTVNVTANDGSNTAQASFTVTVFPGPSNLQQINPSAGITPGSVEILSANSVRIVGAGGTTGGGATADLWTGSSDSNTYLSTPWQVDGTFTARLASLSAADGAAKAGIIFRETTNAGSRYSTIYLIPNNGGAVTFQHKTATNGSSTGTNFFNGSVNSRGIPEWIRMVRQGDTFTLSYSENGTAWTELSSRTNAMTGSTLSVGFVVAPRTGNSSATAVFDNIRFYSPLQSWREQVFGDSIAFGPGADDGDPDHDGVSNLVEYATGGDPFRGGAALTPSLGTPADRLRLMFNSINDPSLVYRVEATGNLLSNPWEVVSEFRGGPGVAGPVEIPDTVMMGTSNPDRRFMRLVVEYDNPSE
jgi:hypothetical protein